MLSFFRAKKSCPRCSGSRCRESRWLSLDEKQKHQDSCPYRCLDCSFRFIAQKKVEFNRLEISVPAALLALVIAVVLTYWLAKPESQAVQSTQTTLAALDPAVRQAAESGDADAQLRLGEALLQDPARTAETSKAAHRWLQLSAENGNTEAMIVLGRLSRTGVGILQNFGQSAKWIETAAARGNSEGMLELGRLYRDGIGVEKSLVLAYVWFNRAAAARNVDAVHERSVIARMLTAEELKMAQNQSVVPAPEKDKPSSKDASKAD